MTSTSSLNRTFPLPSNRTVKAGQVWLPDTRTACCHLQTKCETFVQHIPLHSHSYAPQYNSLTIPPAILWSDIGTRALTQSQDFHLFLTHISSCTLTGQSYVRLAPSAICGIDSEFRHPLPDISPNPTTDSMVQAASHFPTEFHLILDHAIAALDPHYALSPIFRFAAHENNAFLAGVTRRYEMISSTVWDPALSDENVHRLILHKHLLDDNAARHEQVLRFLRSPNLAKWAERLSPAQRVIADTAKRDVEADYEYLLQRCKEYSEHHHVAIGILVNSTALRRNEKQIVLAKQVTKLTVLATVFLPLSFCTSIFGMNFNELDNLSIWVWAAVTLVIGIVTFVVYQWDEQWARSLRDRMFGKTKKTRDTPA
jgi:hypothetical protein